MNINNLPANDRTVHQRTVDLREENRDKQQYHLWVSKNHDME
ncbi:MAG: hypothetical protein AAF773_05380 [Cyanobacteria bacterium P01_D01_bin.115]